MFNNRVKVSKIVEKYILSFKHSKEFMRMMTMNMETVNISLDIEKGTKDYRLGLRQIELTDFDLHKNNCAKVCFCVDMKYFYSVIPEHNKNDFYKVTYKIVSTDYKPNYISKYMLKERIEENYAFFTRLQPSEKPVDLTPYTDLFNEWLDLNRLKSISIRLFDYFHDCGLTEMDLRCVELRDKKDLVLLEEMFKNFESVVKHQEVAFTPLLRLPAIYFVDTIDILDRIIDYCEDRNLYNLNFNLEYNTFNKITEKEKKEEYIKKLNRIFKKVEIIDVKNLEDVL